MIVIRYPILTYLAVSFLARNSGAFDSLIFSQSWPTGLCIKENDCKKTSSSRGLEYWTIHGLWPQNTEQCMNTTFEPAALQKLKPRLKEFWPNMHSREPQDSFWEHEWYTHGVCAIAGNDTNREFKYFNETLAIRQGIDLYQYLKEANIVPSATKPYKLNDILSALKGPLPHKLEILCYKEKSSHRIVLLEIRLCMSTSFKHIDCRAGLSRDQTTDTLMFERNQRSSHQCKNCRCTKENIYYLPSNG